MNVQRAKTMMVMNRLVRREMTAVVRYRMSKRSKSFVRKQGLHGKISHPFPMAELPEHFEMTECLRGYVGVLLVEDTKAKASYFSKKIRRLRFDISYKKYLISCR